MLKTDSHLMVSWDLATNLQTRMILTKMGLLQPVWPSVAAAVAAAAAMAAKLRLWQPDGNGAILYK